MTPVDHTRRVLADPRAAERLVRGLHVLCALAALAAAVLLVDGRLRFLPDEQDYARLAINLAQNGAYSLDGVDPTAFRPPGYAWLLAGAALVSTEIAFLKSVGLVLWLAAAWLTGKIARELAGPLAEAAALTLVLCYPVLLYTAVTLYPQTLAWLLSALLGWLAVRHARGWPAAAAGGAAAALLVLTVPNLFPIVLGYVAAVLWSDDRSRWPKALLVAAIVAAAIGTWTVRNYLAFGAFMPLSSNSGMNLYMGNSLAAEPDSGVAPVADLDTDALAALSEPERNRALMRRAFGWIAANPLDFARLTALKLANWFSFRNRMTGSPASPAQDVVMFVGFYAILGFALARVAAWRAIALKRWETIFLVSYMLVAAGYALFFTRIRFRVPVDFILIVAAAVLVADLARRRVRQPARAT